MESIDKPYLHPRITALQAASLTARIRATSIYAIYVDTLAKTLA